MSVFLAYAIKGWVTPLARHKDNRAGLMATSQLAEEVSWRPRRHLLIGINEARLETFSFVAMW